MNEIPPIKSVMTPFPHSTDVDVTIRQARSMMVELGVRHLPVTQQGDLVGLVTDRDIKRALDPSLGLLPKNELTVRDVCVFDPYEVDIAEPLDRVLSHMAETHIGSALVIEQGRLVGIFTATDACRCFAEHLRSVFPPSHDADIAR